MAAGSAPRLLCAICKNFIDLVSCLVCGPEGDRAYCAECGDPFLGVERPVHRGCIVEVEVES